MEKVNHLLKKLFVVPLLCTLCFSFISCGDDDDKNDYQTDGIDYSTILPGHWKCDFGEWEKVTLSFDYNGKGTILYELLYTNYNNESWEIYSTGTYTLLDNKYLDINYSNVNVVYCDENYNITEEDMSYNGYTTGKPKSMSYNIESFDGKYLILTDNNGRNYSFEKYADLK